MTFSPFQNESDAMSAGGLQIENRIDAISVYGAAAISRDKRGLEDARALRDVFQRIVSVLESTPSLPLETAAGVEEAAVVKNPFA